MTHSKSTDELVEILIAEDSPTQAAQLRRLLELHDYHVLYAKDGKEALELARAHKPTLLISDIVMPEVDGYGLCKAIKSDEALKNIPVILVSTLSDPQDIIRGLDAGADNFIRKPYEEKYLIARINYLLMNFSLRQHQKMQMGVEINLGGKKHFITAERQQIFDLLISVYDQAIGINEDLKARENALAESYGALNALYRVAEGLNQAVNEKEVADRALDRALELPGVEAGWIWLREGDSDFRLAAVRNLPQALDAAENSIDGDCLCQREIKSGELLSATKILRCDRLAKGLGESFGTDTHASVPLRLDGRSIGVLNLVGPTEDEMDERDTNVLVAIGNQLAVALGRASLHENLERLVEQRTAALRAEVLERKRAEARVIRLNRVYAVLSGINTTIVRVHDRQALFEEACRIAAEQGRFRLAWIGEVNTEKSEVAPVASAGFENDYLAQIGLSLDEDNEMACELVRAAVSGRAPIVCNDISTDERMAKYREEALSRGYLSVVVFPLSVGERLVGVLALYSSEIGFFDTEEMKLLTELAGDVSFALEYIEKEEQLNYLAFYDALTGLPNRTLLYERLTQLINSAKDKGELVALILVDLERFRVINETFGQHVGDALLRQVSKRIGEDGVEEGQLARAGADCFAICVTDPQKEADVAVVLERSIFPSLNDPFLIEGQEFRVSAKAGISVFPANGDSADTLFHNAEAALKKAKVGGDKYMFYEPSLNAQVAEKLSLETKLRRALEKDQFVLHYQPKVDLKGASISGMEALMRWNDPDSGLVPPLKFIPILEETGLILGAGRWALEKAISDIQELKSRGVRVPRVAVNVSAIQLRQKDFVETVERVLKEVPNAAENVALEITESLLMHDVEGTIAKLKAIREMGVQISVDDFGTGYSSLSYIARLPIDELKIDRTFIANLAENPDHLSIVSTVISMARSLDLRVVAEGVETDEQAKLLKLLKCDEIQGYLFSPPVQLDHIESMVRERRAL